MTALDAEKAPTRPMPLPFVSAGPDYTPGRVLPQAGRNPYKLSNNESPLGIGALAAKAVRDVSGSQHLYPDPDGIGLAEAIGRINDIDPGRVLVGPGSESIINWIIRGWAGIDDEVLYSAHGFQAYRIRAMNAGARPVAAAEANFSANVDALLAAVTERTRLVFLANPNNPTGTFITPSEIARLLAGLRSDIMLIIDEAYYEYVAAPEYQSFLEIVNDQTENVMVLRTFSKFYGLAGLRVGWVYAPRFAIDALSRVRGPYAVSGVALAAAEAAMGDRAHALAARKHNDFWLMWTQEQLRALGYETTESVCNFVTLKIPGGVDAATAFDRKLRELGFIGRLASQNGLPDWLRLTIGSSEAMQALIPAIASLTESLNE